MDADEKRHRRQRDDTVDKDTVDKDTVDAVERVCALTAADVMSRILLTVTPEQHMVLAWELPMSSGLHHLPVVEDGRCIAVLDDRLLAREWVVGSLSRSQRKIRELCTGPAPSVSPDTPVDRVARLMHLTGADAVTVIGDRQTCRADHRPRPGRRTRRRAAAASHSTARRRPDRLYARSGADAHGHPVTGEGLEMPLQEPEEGAAMTATESERARAEARKFAGAAGRERPQAPDRRGKSRLQRYLAAAFYRETSPRDEREQKEPEHAPAERPAR
jgi:CBS domain-containing protein